MKTEISFENAHALVVGVANYPAVKPLPAAVLNDANSVYDILIDGERCGYPKANVEPLLDDKATKAAIINGLAKLRERCDRESTVLIYVSGHGGRIESGYHVGEYLLPFDADVSTEKELARTSISGKFFSEAVAGIPARQLVVILDCCHASGVAQITGQGDEVLPPVDVNLPALKRGFPEDYYKALKSGDGRAIYSAAKAEELSWVLGGDQNSLFTKYLLAGLRGGVASEDGLVRIFDLFEYVQPLVTGEKASQHPHLRFDGSVNLPLARYLSGQKGKVERTADGFRYDAYLSFTDREPDYTWVWDKIVPRLRDAGLKVAVSGDSEDRRVERVVNMGRGVTQARNTVLVISRASLSDNEAEFQGIMKLSHDLLAGKHSLLLVLIEDISRAELPPWLSPFMPLKLADADPRRAEREFQILIRDLSAPVEER